ncbi:MAG TPA: hypothetical protein VI485_06240 [Vicinamibacterales bacterium]|nr:hypothetical protein [Vicinamibacterales bacterium]
MVITRVSPLSVAKVAGLLYLVIGLIIGGLVSLVAMAGAGFAASQAGSGGFGFAGPLLGVGAVIVLPICYAVFGFLMTLIMTALFNVAVGMVGGIEVDVK